MDFFIKVYKNNFMKIKILKKMKKYLKIILLLLFANQGFSQIDEIRVNLLRAKNQTIEINRNYKLNVQIYPELPRNGNFAIIDDKNRTVYQDEYIEADFVIIDFKWFAQKIKNGKYLLRFRTESEDSENIEEEIITLKLK
jgi:hypothetical protein